MDYGVTNWSFCLRDWEIQRPENDWPSHALLFFLVQANAVIRFEKAHHDSRWKMREGSPECGMEMGRRKSNGTAVYKYTPQKYTDFKRIALLKKL